MKKHAILIVLLVLIFSLPAVAQDVSAALVDSTAEPPPREFRRIHIFPALSYAPETKLTLGVIGYYYMDFIRDDPATQLSNINFLAVYTLANQVAIESRWEMFTNGNRWRFRGEAFYNLYPDRNYGKGNDASVLIAEREGDNPPDTVNYFNFNSDRIRFAPVFIRKIGPSLYVGPSLEVEYVFRSRPIPDSYEFLNADSVRITGLPVEGWRNGLGVQLLLDSRDNVLNPLRGTYLEYSSTLFGSFLGSDYGYNSHRIDLRHYLNTWGQQVFAVRGVANLRFSKEPMPLRGLSRVGGRDFIRGYFKGTYQDDHLLAFEAEYRLPFWNPDDTSPFWKIWRRLGVVAFIGGAQVWSSDESFAFDRFRLAAGGGLRVLLSRESKVNIRIDYAVGLSPDSGGPGKRQTGLYFYLAEAF